MSKYNELWKYIQKENQESMILSYDEIETILGFPLDHSFLTYKKELPEYGYEFVKVYMKDKKIAFRKLK